MTCMQRFDRILARLFDYFTFGALLFFFSFDFLDFSLLATGILVALTPLLFIPFEALSLWLWRTTLGKRLFSLMYARPMSFGHALGLSAKKNLLLWPLFVPLLQCVFGFFYIKELFYPINRFDNMNGEHIKKISDPLWKKGIIILVSAAYLAFAGAPYASFHIIRSALTGSVEPAGEPADWKKVEAKELSCIVSFPSDPVYKEIEHVLKDRSTKLLYKEYSAPGETNLSVGCLDIPKSWTFFGASLVLNKTFALAYPRHKVIERKRTFFKNMPAITYSLEKEGKRVIGIIFLTGTKLYRLESVASAGFEKHEIITQKFFNSFRKIS